MSHPRTGIRADLRAALQAALPGWTVLRAWTKNIDSTTLPAVAVFTPSERQGQDAVRNYTAETDVLVQLRREGGDALEDELDADSILVEAAVMPPLLAIDAHAMLISTEVDIDGSGEQRIGKMNLVFRTQRLITKPY